MKKQVILMMVDTQRQDMLSCYDKDFLPTPNIDSLAQDGAIFENAFTCQPVCGPARSALFTGTFPHTNGMVTNSVPLGANIKNAGQWLSPEGVECGYIGKWHLDGGDYFGYGQCPEGYNSRYWYDMRNFLDELTPEERRLSRKNMNGRNDDPPEESTYAHRCTDRALKFVEEFKDKDFFLTLSFDEPHDPSVCPRRFVDEIKNKKFKFHRTPNVGASLRNKPEHQAIWAKRFKKSPFFSTRMSMRAMLACNSFCDYEFGRLIRRVKELGMEPMMIYTSDHGDMFQSHSIFGKGAAMYNEITKIPLIIKNGGFENTTYRTPVSHIDILPTVMKYFDVKIPKMLQGSPLQGLEIDRERDVFIEFTRYEVDHDGFMGFQPIRCVCDGQYKLVINLLTTDELYDLKRDPYEMKNLIEEKSYEEIRNRLHDKLLSHMNVTRDLYRGYYWGRRSWRPKYKASFEGDGMTRQLEEEDFVQLDYSTGMPMEGATRAK